MSASVAEGGHGRSPALPLPACSLGLAQALTPVDVMALLADLSDFNVPALGGRASPPWARRQRVPLPGGLRCLAAAPGAPCSWGWQLCRPRESTKAAVGSAAVLTALGQRGGKKTGGPRNVIKDYLAGFAAGSRPAASSRCSRGSLPVPVGRALSLPVRASGGPQSVCSRGEAELADSRARWMRSTYSRVGPAGAGAGQVGFLGAERGKREKPSRAGVARGGTAG